MAQVATETATSIRSLELTLTLPGELEALPNTEPYCPESSDSSFGGEVVVCPELDLPPTPAEFKDVEFTLNPSTNVARQLFLDTPKPAVVAQTPPRDRSPKRPCTPPKPKKAKSAPKAPKVVLPPPTAGVPRLKGAGRLGVLFVPRPSFPARCRVMEQEAGEDTLLFEWTMEKDKGCHELPALSNQPLVWWGPARGRLLKVWFPTPLSWGESRVRSYQLVLESPGVKHFHDFEYVSVSAPPPFLHKGPVDEVDEVDQLEDGEIK